MTDWNNVSPTYEAYTNPELLPEEISALPEPLNHRVWATVLEVRTQAYEIGHIDGFQDCVDDQ